MSDGNEIKVEDAPGASGAAVEQDDGSAEKPVTAKTGREPQPSREHGRGGRERGRYFKDRDYRGRKDDERRVGPDGKVFFKKKVCRFCSQKLKIDYKDADTLRRFVTERGKILPRRIMGTCSKHQRAVSLAIKRARIIALLPFAAE